MAQKQKTKQASKREETQSEETTSADTTRSSEVSEDAACCLLEIDAVLADVADEQKSDDEIVAEGPPSRRATWIEMGKPNLEDDDDLDEEFEALLESKLARYKAAYERLTGMEYRDGCVC